jgi:hypothetical protein
MSGAFTYSSQQQMSGQVKIYGELMPQEGARAIGFQLDFIDYQTNVIDFTVAYEATQMKGVMGVFVDNSTNPQPLTIQANQIPQQKIVVPPFAQGSFPVICPIRPKFTLSTNGSVTVGVVFTNIPLSDAVWYTAPASVPTTPTNIEVTTGGTAVNPWGTKHVTGGGFIYNPTSNTGITIYVDLVNSAQDASPGTNGTTVDLQPGDSLPIPAGFISVSVNCATSGTPFVAVGMGVQ